MVDWWQGMQSIIVTPSRVNIYHICVHYIAQVMYVSMYTVNIINAVNNDSCIQSQLTCNFDIHRLMRRLICEIANILIHIPYIHLFMLQRKIGNIDSVWMALWCLNPKLNTIVHASRIYTHSTTKTTMTTELRMKTITCHICAYMLQRYNVRNSCGHATQQT